MAGPHSLYRLATYGNGTAARGPNLIGMLIGLVFLILFGPATIVLAEGVVLDSFEVVPATVQQTGSQGRSISHVDPPPRFQLGGELSEDEPDLGGEAVEEKSSDGFVLGVPIVDDLIRWLGVEDLESVPEFDVPMLPGWVLIFSVHHDEAVSSRPDLEVPSSVDAVFRKTFQEW